MSTLVSIGRVVQPIAFTLLALASLRLWRRSRGAAASWLAATFGSLAVVSVVGGLLPEHGDGLDLALARKVVIVVLLLFPYFLYRFTATFGAWKLWLHRLVTGLTAAGIVATLALPHLPETDEHRPAWFGAYVLLVVVEWTVISGSVAIRLWNGGRDQPSVARHRMRLLSLGSAVMNLALVVAAGAPSNGSDAVTLTAQILSLVSAAGFFLGFAPPTVITTYWRRDETAAFRDAQADLIEASTIAELVEGLLPPLAALVGARAIVLTGAEHELVGTFAASDEDARWLTSLVESAPALPPEGAELAAGAYVVPTRSGWLGVILSVYMPFFGRQEIELFHALARFSDLVAERVRLYEREREARQELEDANRALTRSQERFRLLVDGVHDYAFFLLDPDGTITSWNSGAQRLKGYRTEEIVGRSFTVFYQEQDLAAGKPGRLLATAATVGQVEDQGWRVRKDGRRFWADVLITALFDEARNLVGYAKVTRDITDRRAAEEALLESEARFRGSFDSASIGMALVGPDGSFLQVNPAMAELTGWSAAELLERNTIDLVHPDDRIESRRVLDRMAAGDLGRHQEERRYIRADGTVMWAIHTAAPVYGAEGALRYFTSQLHDITDRKVGGEAQFRLALEAAAIGTWDWDITSGEWKWSAIQLQLLGLLQGTVGSYERMLDQVHPDDRSGLAAEIASAMAKGMFEHEFRVVWADGTTRWLYGRGQTLNDPSGAPRRMVGITLDVSGRRAAEAEQVRFLALQQQAANRAIRMQSITADLSEALTSDDVIDVLGEQAAQLLDADGEWLMMLVDGDALVVARIDDRIAESSPAGSRFPLDLQVPVMEAVRTRTPLYMESYAALAAAYPELTEAAVDRGRAAWAFLPLVASGQVIGAWVLGFTTEQTFSPEDRAFMESLAGQSAQALERARLYEQEHSIAETLQRSLLPDRLPETVGAQTAARYEAGGPGVDVGGDWYDVIPLPDGAVGVVIGDVVGHGIRAATVMGQLRSSLRAYALEGHGPADVLAGCNRVVIAMGAEQMATALYGIVNPATGTLCQASAGHPPALVVDAEGARYLTGGRNLPLGVSPHSRFVEEQVVLAPGSTLICYTDGLIEKRGDTINAGLDRLARAASEAVANAPDDLEALCDLVLDQLRSADHDDDTALVALRLVSDVTTSIELHVPTNFDELAPMRRRVGSWLTSVGAADDDVQAVVLATCEAVTNAIEHGYGPVDASVLVSAALQDDGVMVTVRDNGSWREARGVDRGRGLMLIEALMHRCEVRRSEHGTEVLMWRALNGASAMVATEATAGS